MATLVRRLFKIGLFISLFLLSVRYVPPNNVWTKSESNAYWAVSEWLSVQDPRDFYFVFWVTVELIVAVLAYVAIVKLWRWYRTK
ncbi:hypothetical protein F0160_04320 [Paraburkholderia sp. JPY303]|uniref:Transmembrane protein n=1 Tax=Paraburkholderia atlantica TaxID=2654982 RepID=A0A7W8Q9T1_PARAM|nr:hypothetical protein [Paraburkholderia atlantica]MBB5426467.1 hypothetical protein [Paraburkholderia atlantica]NUY29746.1 hypothetical protein [Paraburkholderia atlantica]